MKIAYLTVSMPFGYSEAFLIPEAVALQELEKEVVIIPRSPSGQLISQDAAPIAGTAIEKPLLSFEILLKAAVFAVLHPGRFATSVLPLFAQLSLTHSIKNAIVIPKALWLADLVMKRGIAHIHCHWALTTATIALVASKASGVKWSLTCHRGDIADNNLLGLKLKSACFTRFISEDGRQMAASLAGAQACSKSCVIRMGVKTPSTIKPFCGTHPRIICPANLLPVKGHSYLIQAANILKHKGLNFEVLIAGKGPLEQDLKHQVDTLGLSKHVIFVGQLAHHELLGYYEAGEVFAVVLPSVDLGKNLREGVPVCLIEALAYGVPAISTSTGGIPELLEGVGILVKDKDPEALADAIELMIKNEAERQRMIVAGLNKVRDEYDVSKTARLLLEKIKGCAES